VSRGLVHEQEVRRIDEKFHEIKSRFFTAREDSAAFLDIRAAEEKGAEDGAGFFFTESGAGGEDFFEDGVVFV
jgi:hypothetical protein